MVKRNVRIPAGIIRFCKNFGLLIFYLAATLGFGVFAWYLHAGDSRKPGQTTEETITWHGHSGLNPSVDATNQAAESAASHDTFTAGVFFGLASGTAVALVDGLWNTFIRKKEE